jgi:hypothetical protein
MDVHPTKNVSIGIDPYPYLGGKLFEAMGLAMTIKYGGIAALP